MAGDRRPHRRQRLAQRRAAREKEATSGPPDRIASLSFSRKLDWAGKHIEDLRQTANTWLGTDAYTFVPDTDPQTGRTAVRAHVRKPPPPELALLIGDAVHALRSALDHLAFELAVAFARPGAIPSQLEETSEFVIVGCADKLMGAHKFNSAAGTKLKGIDPDARNVIEGIQPYHREAAYVTDPLWVIHHLDRIDKHRRLNLTAYAMGSVGIGPAHPGRNYIEYLHIEKIGHNGPVEDGDEVAAFTARNAEFKMNFAREIALAEPTLPNAAFAVKALTDLRDYVRNEVVPLLARFL